MSMSFDERLAERVRLSLGPRRHVEERRMFGGIAFMVRGKMCVCVGRDRLMCRIDPDSQDELVAVKKCRVVVMKGRPMRGYVHVDAASVRTKRALDHWIGASLTYNARIA